MIWCYRITLTCEIRWATSNDDDAPCKRFQDNSHVSKWFVLVLLFIINFYQINRWIHFVDAYLYVRYGILLKNFLAEILFRLIWFVFCFRRFEISAFNFFTFLFISFLSSKLQIGWIFIECCYNINLVRGQWNFDQPVRLFQRTVSIRIWSEP